MLGLAQTKHGRLRRRSRGTTDAATCGARGRGEHGLERTCSRSTARTVRVPSSSCVAAAREPSHHRRAARACSKAPRRHRARRRGARFAGSAPRRRQTAARASGAAPLPGRSRAAGRALATPTARRASSSAPARARSPASGRRAAPGCARRPGASAVRNRARAPTHLPHAAAAGHRQPRAARGRTFLRDGRTGSQRRRAGRRRARGPRPRTGAPRRRRRASRASRTSSCPPGTARARRALPLTGV